MVNAAFVAFLNNCCDFNKRKKYNRPAGGKLNKFLY